MPIMPQSSQYTIMSPSAYSPVAYYSMDPTNPNGRFDVYVSPYNSGAGVNTVYSRQSGDVGYGYYNNTQYNMSDYGQTIYQNATQNNGYYPQQPYTYGFRPIGYPFGLMQSGTQSMMPIYGSGFAASPSYPTPYPFSAMGPTLGRLYS